MKLSEEEKRIGKMLRGIINQATSDGQPLYPTKLRLKKMHEMTLGEVGIVEHKGKKYFEIVLNTQPSLEMTMIHALTHELGHVRQWRLDELSRDNNHDAEFGIHFAHVMRIVGEN